MQSAIKINALSSISKRRRARGSFITEFMGTWGLYALIGALALAAIGTAYIIFWGTSETENVSRLYSGVMPLKSARGGYGPEGTDLVPVLVSTDVVPRNMNVTGTGASAQIRNNWGGTVTVVSADGGQKFTISLGSVPSTQCPKMVQTLSNSGSFSAITVGSTAITDIPTTIAEASAACGTGGAVDIALTSQN
ncbi:type 4 pilus major pilin [Bordetella flabilis]|uniref:Type 4 secretion system PilS N-terminal domain-containing protein n=1 Tax=Bordetella flabilis TaxID=463014 RepID=A0A193GLQ7_9BORD|nr:type 4 pilus major pilin [Bordetella flabilis]ANN80805.1 hypothetical protein BAU07_26100 [Bordetella flabilis]